ncbi:MAG: hypothetical protein HZC51_07340 [Nitrospirae bacterium]|nr:hypothetical protein [Nitrospirota bacterium]
MILWDRLKRSMDDGIEVVTRVARVVAARTKTEAAVARLMVDKGGLETKLDRLNRRLGERVCFLWEQKNSGIAQDPEVVETLREIALLKERVAAIKLDIRRAALGEEEG